MTILEFNQHLWLAYSLFNCLVRDLFGITRVWRIWVSSGLYQTPPPSTFGDVWCYELRNPLQSAFSKAQFSGDTLYWPLNNSSGLFDLSNILLFPLLVFSKLVAFWKCEGWNTCHYCELRELTLNRSSYF